jgi:hypothetical protein
MSRNTFEASGPGGVSVLPFRFELREMRFPGPLHILHRFVGDVRRPFWYVCMSRDAAFRHRAWFSTATPFVMACSIIFMLDRWAAMS